IGRSRGGLTTKIHLVCDGKARALAFVLTGGQVADTSMFTDVLDEIRIPGRGPARTRPDRVLADKGYPSKKNRAWLRERGVKATIPERDDQIEKRRKKPGRPIDFGDEQQERYKGRNVVERCFNFVKQWRGLASRYDKTARSYAAGLCLSAALQWIQQHGLIKPSKSAVRLTDGSLIRTPAGSEFLRVTSADTTLPRSMPRVSQSFWSLLQTNVLNQQRWATKQELRLAIVVW